MGAQGDRHYGWTGRQLQYGFFSLRKHEKELALSRPMRRDIRGRFLLLVVPIMPSSLRLLPSSIFPPLEFVFPEPVDKPSCKFKFERFGLEFKPSEDRVRDFEYVRLPPHA